MKPTRWWMLSGPLLLIVLTSACASGGQAPDSDPAVPEETHQETPEAPVQPDVSTEPTEHEPEPEPEPLQGAEEDVEAEIAADQEEGSGAYGPKTMVMPSPETESKRQAQTLAEAARQARERRGDDQPPIAVITDETLSEFATGELTVASQPAATTPPPNEDPLGDLLSQEEYWRTQVREARILWRDLVDEIAELEGDVGTLRNRFYAEDDGFFRDSQIKPSWDRALDRLAEAKVAVVAAEENVRTVLKEGRQAGALPGWLREGLEYEPTPENNGGRPPGTHEPGEPQIVEEDGGR